MKINYEIFTEVFEDITSSFKKIPNQSYQEKGQFPIIDQGNDFIGGYTDDSSFINSENLPLIIFGDHTKIFKYIDFPFAIGADGVKVLKLKKINNSKKFYYYYLRSLKIIDKGYSRHFKYLKLQLFPVFDTKQQIHIADVLSRAEDLIQKRKASIALLDEFLKSQFWEMFGDPVRNEKGWEVKPMTKIGVFVSGGTPSKKREDFWTGNFPWVSPKDMKFSLIYDSIDHVSDKVFKETNLKKIESNNLLIVVRGMILAHSFPIAINKTNVSINQDMKAILLNEEYSAIFVKSCLNSMERQVLASITNAGHGTKKLDLNMMEKILIPLPPIEIQNQFSRIVEKTEGLKAGYQKSLTELENLYGVLSQTAFRGELG